MSMGVEVPCAQSQEIVILYLATSVGVSDVAEDVGVKPSTNKKSDISIPQPWRLLQPM